jgi:fructokinase
MNLVCLGEFILDMFPAESGRDFLSVSAFQPVPGGAPANVAVAATRLGVPSAFIGKVGADPFGRRLAAVLERCGVDTRGMRYDPHSRTTLNFITLPDPNSAEYLFYRNPGADMMLRPEELDRELLEQAGIFHFGSVSLTAEPCRAATLEAARIARAAGALVSFDVNYRPTLWESERSALTAIKAALPLADIVKVNEKELGMLERATDPQEACRALAGRGPALCVATLGPHGSVYATRSISGLVAGFRVRTIDATGCGDAFMGALLARLAEGLGGEKTAFRPRLASLPAASLSAALAYANAAGGLAATKKGVIPALPSAGEVERFLRQTSKAKALDKSKPYDRVNETLYHKEEET